MACFLRCHGFRCKLNYNLQRFITGRLSRSRAAFLALSFCPPSWRGRVGLLTSTASRSFETTRPPKRRKSSPPPGPRSTLRPPPRRLRQRHTFFWSSTKLPSFFMKLFAPATEAVECPEDPLRGLLRYLAVPILSVNLLCYQANIPRNHSFTDRE